MMQVSEALGETWHSGFFKSLPAQTLAFIEIISRRNL